MTERHWFIVSVVTGWSVAVLFCGLAMHETRRADRAEQLNGLKAVTTTITPTSAVSSTFSCYAYIQGEPWTRRAEVFESHQPAHQWNYFTDVDGASCFDVAGKLTDNGGLGVDAGKGGLRRCAGR